jgi:hypothetical protein
MQTYAISFLSPVNGHWMFCGYVDAKDEQEAIEKGSRNNPWNNAVNRESHGMSKLTCKSIRARVSVSSVN